jgi:hypothetical protein
MMVMNLAWLPQISRMTGIFLGRCHVNIGMGYQVIMALFAHERHNATHGEVDWSTEMQDWVGLFSFSWSRQEAGKQ